MQNKFLEILFATGNEHKFKEVSAYFKKKENAVTLTQRDLNAIEIQTDSIKNVAEFKLKSLINKIKGNIMIEDAGFFVEELNGFPGVYSSFVMKTIGNQGILDLLKDNRNRRAKFHAVVAFYFTGDEHIHFFNGEVEGKVSYTIKGDKGFGFDPIFIPDDLPDKTFGEISTDSKNEISHRSKAISKLSKFLKDKGY
jgi:XTP/dITP diphosphohydrolase